MASYVFTDVNLREAQLYADYVSIEHDLSRTRDFVAMVLQEQRNAQPNWSLLGALMVAVIVQYARPFSGDQRARTGEKRELILSPEQLEAHQYYLAIRSKFIAHSVNAFEDNQPVAYYVAEEPEQGVTSISTESTSDRRFQKSATPSLKPFRFGSGDHIRMIPDPFHRSLAGTI